MEVRTADRERLSLVQETGCDLAKENHAQRVGLRQRKKLRTRHTIVAVAVRLFAERGYVQTTVSEIATGAEIAPSTFFNYFASKADVVFDLIDIVLESATERIVNRPGGEPATAALLAWVERDLSALERPYAEAQHLLPRIIAAVPELRSAERLRLAILEDALAAAFARDLSEPTDGLRARVMAAIALRAMLDVWECWYQHHVAAPRLDPSEALARTTEYLERALRAGLVAIKSLPDPPAQF